MEINFWATATILMGVINGLLWMWINSINKKITTLEEEVKQMKYNYLNRFQGVKDHISEENKCIVAAINQVKIELERVKREN